MEYFNQKGFSSRPADLKPAMFFDISFQDRGKLFELALHRIENMIDGAAPQPSGAAPRRFGPGDNFGPARHFYFDGDRKRLLCRLWRMMRRLCDHPARNNMRIEMFEPPYPFPNESGQKRRMPDIAEDDLQWLIHNVPPRTNILLGENDSLADNANGGLRKTIPSHR